MPKELSNEIEKQMTEMIKLTQSIRDLLILNLSYTDAPHEKIARAAHIQTSKLYEIIPKQGRKKKARDNNKQVDDGQ